jgi:D-sedoheptulose 7-phosphate isomerase
MNFIEKGFKEAETILSAFTASMTNMAKMEQAISIMAEQLRQGGKIMSCGNGGSMCDAMHFAEELTGRFRKDRKALNAIALSDPAHITCVANDFGYDQIFARGVEAYGRRGDILLAISTSGNSPNIVEAVKYCEKNSIKTIGLFGKGGGALKDKVDIAFIIESDVSERIQEMHIKIIHLFIEGIERKLFPQNYF